jgi:hypothetical protein
MFVSDYYASHQRSGYNDADTRHHLVLSGIDQCSVSSPLMSRRLLTRSITAGTQTPIVYPESILGWFLLSIIAVSIFYMKSRIPS